MASNWCKIEEKKSLPNINNNTLPWQRSSSDKAYIFPSWPDYKTLIFKLP